MSIKHTFVSAKAETTDSTIAGANEWNAAHTIDAGTIGTTELADGGVTTAKLAANAVTTAKLATTAVTPGSYTAANITVDVDGRITAAANGAGGGGGGITNTAGNNVLMKSNGTNAVASGLSDDGTTITTTGNRTFKVAAGTGDQYPLRIEGPISIVIPVTDAQSGEIVQMTLTGNNRVGPSPGADCFAFAIRNGVNFDTTLHVNQCGGVYAEATGIRSAGSQTLTNMAFEGCATGGDLNYSFVSYAGKGLARFDDGMNAGPSSVTGAFTQTAGNVALLSGTSTCTINGATHITGTNPNLSVDGTSLLSGTVTCNGQLRANGVVNLAGGTGQVYVNRITWTTESLSASGAASIAAAGVTWVSGTGTNLTLANGVEDGQEKTIMVVSGTGQITPANFGPGTKYTWSAGGQSCVLVWNNSTTKWWPKSMLGMTLV